jgi:hypothetical protein
MLKIQAQAPPGPTNYPTSPPGQAVVQNGVFRLPRPGPAWLLSQHFQAQARVFRAGLWAGLPMARYARDLPSKFVKINSNLITGQQQRYADWKWIAHGS